MEPNAHFRRYAGRHRLIAVLIPARNEVDYLQRCLTSVRAAGLDPLLLGEPVAIVVAADSCTDATERVAGLTADHVVAGEFGNVGSARAAAATRAIELGARWLASTDADTVVPENWLSAQLAYGADAFCGIVTVLDWEDYGQDVVSAFHGSEVVTVGHPHVHGANLGVSTAAYRKAGGFEPGQAHEDVSLVDRLVASGASIARQPTPCVITSARRDSRAREGFSDYLKAMEKRLAESRSVEQRG